MESKINSSAILFQIRSCAKQKDLLKGSKIHSVILKAGLLKTDIYIGSALVSLYAKCGAFMQAREIFAQLPDQNAVTWTSLISGYVQHGCCDEALNCYELMQCQGSYPDALTFVCISKACGSLGKVNKGKYIHAMIMQENLLQKNIKVGTTLVDMYAKCGALEDAQEVFNKLPVKDAFSWATLISGYAHHGHSQDALNCFEQLQCDGQSLHASILVPILKACGNLRAIDKGKDIHAMIIRQGLLQNNMMVGTALVDMYTKCGMLAKAQEIFDLLPVHDIVSWTTLISGYSQRGYTDNAFSCYKQMQHEGLSPDAFAVACILKSTNVTTFTQEAKEIHVKIINQNLLKKSIFVGNALVDTYVKQGLLAKAREVFCELPIKDVISWNSLIAGYAEYGTSEEAVNCFEQMQQEGLFPNSVTYLSFLKAFHNREGTEKGKMIHSSIVSEKLLDKSILIGAALVDMYGKTGLILMAEQVFNSLKVRDVFTWNAMIAGYVQYHYGSEAFNCFGRMQTECISPDATTYVAILQACAINAAVKKGKEVHVEILQRKYLEEDASVGNVLIFMYAKCGDLVSAQCVFDEISCLDVVSWTVLMAGYAHVGKVDIVFNLFDSMLREGIGPNVVTFTIVLNACRHSGLLENGQLYFEAMIPCYGVIPNSEHFTCMVDLFARAGHFDKALAMIRMMPSIDYLPVWTAMLGACQKWGNLEVARLAFKHVVRLDEDYHVAYICMSNICTSSAMQEKNQFEVS